MRAIPTSTQFEALGRSVEQFVTLLDAKFSEIIEDVCAEPNFHMTDPMILELAENLKSARLEACQLRFDEEADVAYAWLDSEALFQIALQKLGFSVSSDENPYKKIIEEHQRTLTEWRPYLIKRSVLRHATLYLSYVSGVAKASSGFITGERRKAALEGPRAIQRMLELMEEIEKIRDNTDFLGRKVSIGGRFWDLTKSNMEGSLEHLFSTTRRDDKDLATRLMASELIRLHIKLFDAPHKNSVFHLMGLPFIDRPIEMKTIERLVALEKSRAEKLISSKLSILGREIIC
ncbi:MULTISPECIES: hypothetical protein [Pseudomonas syringae group]|uniref:Uncharacterized protein n=3 Tax=Pseudomonas syringae group TaxID=136849 RepID=A0A2K4WZU3_PSESX|nr:MULTISPECIES: hypothetical protein [Pseudomonas syringae group]EGH20552.1 hypothetical protein PSYMO_03246 [Pseudomonas amygdali pv. mori str. 301020]AVB13426.1 hypothetical protein BKM19_007265 [Pseudomonas amygdali pv. morsprunorum]KWS51285.1 hypothetical protein AL056_12095 [Pseudomonas amygdali pv. morsprunorum]KWS69704.1 hypothetical protein AL054_18360 [Pseudomonas amygdali pv. morsprunorum]MBI6729758.1 hypothetical protein [Pseudomonas amygdali]